MNIDDIIIDTRERPSIENIDLEGVYKLNFFNVSFREYLAFYGDYIICIYPFALSLYYNTDVNGLPITYEKLKHSFFNGNTYTHSDYLVYKLNTNGQKLNIDPSILFEQVHGIKIHHGESDRSLMNLNHSLEIEKFNLYVKSKIRDKKLKELGI